MKTYLIFAVFGLGLASTIPSPHPFSDEYIQEINAKQSTWIAGKNFEEQDYALFKILASGAKRPLSIQSRLMVVHDEEEDVPESFDSREAWSDCAEIIGQIRDQSRCGACWAFAAVEAMSDRICIHSNGQRKIYVSSQDMLTCGTGGGCDGGWPYEAWYDWTTTGVVTGGLYNRTDEGCKSYFLPSCEDHPNKCTDYVDTPACVQQCDDNTLTYTSQTTYGQTSYSLAGEKQIQLEIYKNGPVEATMDVYMDFASYQSGIYQRTTDDYEGGHAVKIVGWGVENDVKYWLIANSWNERWGENGYFRILRGVDEVGIESNIDAGLPDFTKF